VRLLYALQNYRDLAEGVSPAKWGDLFAIEPGPCAWTKRIRVIDPLTGKQKRNNKGEFIYQVRTCRHEAVPGYEYCRGHGGPADRPAGRGNRVPDPMALVRFKADIDRQIDRLPPGRRLMFDLLYRRPLPLEPGQLRSEWTEADEFDRVDQIRHQLGYSEPGVFWEAHNESVAEMERNLLNYFPEARHAA
jgi:hypothetical protein